MTIKSVVIGGITALRAKVAGTLELAAELRELLTREEELRQERDRQNTLPLCASDVQDIFRGALATLQKLADENLEKFLRDIANRAAIAPGSMSPTGPYTGERAYASAQITSALLAEALLERAERLLAKHPPTPTLAERAKRIKQIGDELEVIRAKRVALEDVLREIRAVVPADLPVPKRVPVIVKTDRVVE